MNMPADTKGQRSAKVIHPAADYSSVDPTPVTLAKGAADGLRVTVKPTLLSGAGCTVTVTLTDADTTRVIGSAVVVTSAANKTAAFALPKDTRRVTVTPVGSGTRTTLTYSIECEWANLNYAASPYWNGTAYVNNDEATKP